MPEIKNTFSQGKMNKDLDERFVPNGQYRDALNIDITSSEDGSAGTAQNIPGNLPVEDLVSSSDVVEFDFPTKTNEKLEKSSSYISTSTLKEISLDENLAEIVKGIAERNDEKSDPLTETKVTV